ncbi:MAG TPA: GNAT family N-acetyltransferase [Kiloniellales bacterium]|nr:GNAT family N-acetyltransferase [Kiloniellales bacterium]
MSPAPALRALRPDDLEALACLHAECFPEAPWSRGELALLLAQPETAAFLAEGEGGLQGFILLRRAAEEAEVLSLGVAHRARRRGLASRLLAAGRAWLGSGTERLFLEVAAGNAAALALYRSLGFRAVGRRDKYYADGSDALVLRRDLRNLPDDNLDNP